MSRETLIKLIENWLQQMDYKGLRFVYAFMRQYLSK